jgi:hypothetical protein
MGSVAPRAIARIEHSEALLAALRRRLDELQITHETVDHLSGFASGYASKLLSDPPTKRLGHFSLFVLLQTLGLDIVLVENPEALEALRNPMHRRRQAFVLKRPGHLIFSADFLRRNGSKGGNARARKLTPRQLSEIGRLGAQARLAKLPKDKLSKQIERMNRIRQAKRRRKVQATAAAALPPVPASP